MKTELIEHIISTYEEVYRNFLNDDGTVPSMFEIAQRIKVCLDEEPIDEKKLDELAEKEKFNRLIVDKLSEFTEYEGYKINLLMKDMYKAGYRKAKEEQDMKDINRYYHKLH